VPESGCAIGETMHVGCSWVDVVVVVEVVVAVVVQQRRSESGAWEELE
jgi:hypothetical protein